MKMRILPVLTLFALLPAAAAAQSPEERIAAAKESATAAGIPQSLLETKIAEGKAKGVSLDRIADVIARRLVTLTRARDAMRKAKNVGEADLDAGATALGAGITEKVLQTISEKAPQERRAVAITILTELVAQGEKEEQALASVTEALARGPEALANLPARAAEARARSGAPVTGPGAIGGGKGPQGRAPVRKPPTPPRRPGGN